MKLTKGQEEAMNKLQDGKWHSAYDLQVGLNTLNGLEHKGLVISKQELGSFFSPRLHIEWRIKEKKK